MPRYRSPRIWEELKALGWKISRKRVERLMKEHGLGAKKPKSWAKTTDSKHNLPVVENILGRDFRVFYAGEKWVSDITYLRSASGWLYMTVIFDLWDRKVIG